MRVFRDASTFGKWYVDYFWHGKRVRLMAGTSQQAANKLRNRIENDINAGKHDPARLRQELRGRNPGGMTFGELCDTFLRLHLSRGGTGTPYYRQAVARFTRFIPRDTPSVAITPLFIEELQPLWREHGWGPATIRKNLISMGKIFRWAISKGLATENPASSLMVTRPPIPEGRKLTITDEQMLSVLHHCGDDPNLVKLVRFLRATGMRLSEPLKLRRAQVDYRTNLIHVKDRKMGNSMWYPLTPLLKDILASGVRHIASDWVFCDEHGKPWNHNAASKCIKRAMVAAGIPAASAHTLRHTFTSELTERGESFELIGELLGVKSAYIVAHYSHLTPESKRRRMLALHSEGAADQEKSKDG